MKCIYEYSDNCVAQYKSNIPFRILSKSTIPIMGNYFCEKHGKSVADGLIGRLSQFLYTAVCMEGEELPDVEALYKFCKENWKEKRLIGACQHYERNFFLTKNIKRPTDLTANTLQGTRQIHSIRSVGDEGVVEIREPSCFCSNCRGGQGECINNYFILPWQRKKLLGNVHVSMKNHWNHVYISDDDEQEENHQKITPRKCDVRKRGIEKKQHNIYLKSHKTNLPPIMDNTVYKRSQTFPSQK